MRRTIALLLALSLTPLVACSSTSPAKGKVDVSLTKADAGGTATAKPGEVIEVRLSSPRGVAPEYRHTWSNKPAIVGDALRFVSYSGEGPGDDVDGGSFRYVYRFEAMAVGEAKLRIDILERGEEAPEGPWTATITVAE